MNKIKKTTKFSIIPILTISFLILTISYPVFSVLIAYHSIPSGGSIFYSSIVTATSGSPEDIQDAVNLVIPFGGGTVLIPEGEYVFNPNPVTIVSSNPIDLTIKGAGVGLTVLRQTSEPPSGTSMFEVKTGGFVHISGLTLIGKVVSSEVNTNSRGIVFDVPDQTTLEFRVDHINFIDFSSAGIQALSQRANTKMGGLIDHCSFDNPYKDSIGGIWGYGVVIYSGQLGPWQPLSNVLGKYNLNTRGIVYIEDCTFSRTRHAVAGNGGAWYVVRYSTFKEPRPKNFGMIDVHGISGITGPGGRGLESYHNTLIGVSNSGSIAHLIRGGSGVIYSNTIRDCQIGIWLQREGDVEQNWVSDMYIWNINQTGGTQVSAYGNVYTEGVEYFLYEKLGYTPYTYPHPLTYKE